MIFFWGTSSNLKNVVSVLIDRTGKNSGGFKAGPKRAQSPYQASMPTR